MRTGARGHDGDARFLRACRGEPVDRVPVWFMRQAGRSLPEYRAIRAERSLLEICRTPEIAAEVSLQPVRRLGVDACIVFADIVLPLQAMGVELDIRPGVGPVVAEPVRDSRAIERLAPLDPAEGVPFVLETVRILAAESPVPVIGFAGAPFTLASYLVEGGPSRTHARTKALMHADPDAWERLTGVLALSIRRYLDAQVEAGAAAVQLFDSWAGALPKHDYIERAMPASRSILEGLSDRDVPRIHFGVGTGEILGAMADAGADVVGVDWRVPLDDARGRVGPRVALQGNLDPAAVLAPWPAVEAAAVDVLRRGAGTGHVFNLGHGVLPETDPDTLARLVELVHSWEPEAER